MTMLSLILRASMSMAFKDWKIQATCWIRQGASHVAMLELSFLPAPFASGVHLPVRRNISQRFCPGLIWQGPMVSP
jgi:hypothetical protein